jgi:hypothetical protein
MTEQINLNEDCSLTERQRSGQLRTLKKKESVDPERDADRDVEQFEKAFREGLQRIPPVRKSS